MQGDQQGDRQHEFHKFKIEKIKVNILLMQKKGHFAGVYLKYDKNIICFIDVVVFDECAE